eukprot:jgi/Undpi1/12873/HiC_scaffold_7.g02540.m1
MGTCHSKERVTANTPEKDGNRPTHLGEVGQDFASSIETPTSFMDSEPRIVLSNRSKYTVSYWVVQEDKKRTTSHLKSIVSNIGLHLNAGNAGASVTGDLERNREETKHIEVGVYYLMKDYRMGPEGTTATTQVPFPADCEDVRVYGFFDDGGEWRAFKDKLYSISRRNKIFELTASTPNITPYAK